MSVCVCLLLPSPHLPLFLLVHVRTVCPVLACTCSLCAVCMLAALVLGLLAARRCGFGQAGGPQLAARSWGPRGAVGRVDHPRRRPRVVGYCGQVRSYVALLAPPPPACLRLHFRRLPLTRAVMHRGTCCTVAVKPRVRARAYTGPLLGLSLSLSLPLWLRLWPSLCPCQCLWQLSVSVAAAVAVTGHTLWLQRAVAAWARLGGFPVPRPTSACG